MSLAEEQSSKTAHREVGNFSDTVGIAGVSISPGLAFGADERRGGGTVEDRLAGAGRVPPRDAEDAFLAKRLSLALSDYWNSNTAV